MLIADTIEAKANQRIALIVYNSTYAHLPLLDSAARDAALIEKALTEDGFGQVIVVNDLDATRLRTGLETFARWARLADVAVIYFAGHGLEFEGRNYLLPVEADPGNAIDLTFGAIPADLATFAVGRARRLGLVLLDACRAPPRSLDADGPLRGYGVGLAEMTPQAGVMIGFAAAAGQVARDGGADGPSPFAAALAQHLTAKNTDIREVMGRVRDAVIATTAGAQVPWTYASLSSTPVGLGEATLATRPRHDTVEVDFLLADPRGDPDVARLATHLDEPVDFGYELIETDRTRVVAPATEYFRSMSARGRPLTYARMIGYFSPGTVAWGQAFPLIDLIVRRAVPDPTVLAELVVDVRSSTPDLAGYIAMAGVSDRFCTLGLVHEGWGDLRRVRLHFDVFGFDEPSWEDVDAYTRQRSERDFAHRVVTKLPNGHRQISLARPLIQAIPDLACHRFAFRGWRAVDKLNHRYGYKLPADELWRVWWNDHLDDTRRAAAPDSFLDWFEAHLPRLASSEGFPIWIVGRVVSEPTDPAGATTVADFAAPLAVDPPEGLGGGDIDYDSVASLQLDVDRESYQVRHGLGYLLDTDTTVFRGLFSLTAARSSRHELRLRLRGNGGRDLHTSDWMQAHILVPRTARAHQVSAALDR